MNMFVKASKRQLKARLALAGPTGSGKSWTALEWATVLGKKIAVIDTERGSASLYSNHFDFDVLEMAPPYAPERCVEGLRDAEASGYEVVIIDSLTHFWQGEGGTLDIKESASKRLGGNDYAGWSVATPALRHLIDTMLGIDCHLIVTMRSKMDYIQQKDANGSIKIVKVGMAPVMRDGVEYEFTVIGDIDLDHCIDITKSRCDLLANTMVPAGRAREAAETFKGWLNDGEPVADRDEIAAIRARVKAIGDRELRADCSNLLGQRFGPVDRLTVSQLTEVEACIAEFERAARPLEDHHGDDECVPCEFCGTSPCECAPSDEPPAG